MRQEGIAGINGYAVGGGLEIALAADIRIAAEGAQFWFPETSIGRFITGGSSILLPRLVGLGQAKRLVYTGERIGVARTLSLHVYLVAERARRMMSIVNDTCGQHDT